jgi:DNA-binding NarL/FixJ family response regulator
MTYKVFVSYASEDKTVADAICLKLEQENIACWIAPRDVLPGHAWATAISDAIGQSQVLVLVFSESANSSNQVPNEVALAVDSGKPVIPFRVRPIDPTGDLEYYLEAQHWLDAFPEPMQPHLDRLVQAVRSYIDIIRDPDRITVGIIDDHPLFRQGLAMAIDGASDQSVVAEAKSIEEFEKLSVKPDVLLLDLHLPGIEGAAGVAHMCDNGHVVLVVSAAGTPENVVEAIAAGASGYLTKETDAEEITRAVRVVAGGKSYVSPTLASYLLRVHHTATAVSLTKREREVLELLAAGETDQDIADQLFIARATVHSHLERIRNKTGARRRAELTNLANRMGITSEQGKLT